MPLGVLLGLVFCGIGAIVAESWWPVIFYLTPWTIFTLIHYFYKHRFLNEAAWCIRIKATSQSFIFVYSPSLAVYAALIEWSHLYGLLISFTYTLFAYFYFRVYLRRTYSAWEEKRTSNYRFAINPDRRTFRFDQGFNFGSIPGMWWDNLIFGAILSLSTFSGALIGGLAYDLDIAGLVIGVTGALMSLAWIRGSLPREVVTLQKIQEYEEEHGVTIRPR